MSILSNPIAREHSNIDSSELRDALAVVDDLLYFSQDMLLDWWDDEDALIQHGWQPPTAKEGHS